MSLQKALATTCKKFSSLPTSKVEALFFFIDRLKLQGHTVGRAFSNYCDHLPLLGIACTDLTDQFFAYRWADKRVWIPVPVDLKDDLGTMPLFTPFKIDEGDIYKCRAPLPPYVHPGTTRFSDEGHDTQLIPMPRDPSTFFIIDEFIPEHFYMELPNDEVLDALRSGLPNAPYDEPYRLALSPEGAKGSLVKLRLERREPIKYVHAALSDYTMLSVDTNKMDLDPDHFKIHISHHHKATNYAVYLYTGDIPAQALEVVTYETHINKR
jgi:hypothetical protein